MKVFVPRGKEAFEKENNQRILPFAPIGVVRIVSKEMEKPSGKLYTNRSRRFHCSSIPVCDRETERDRQDGVDGVRGKR